MSTTDFLVLQNKTTKKFQQTDRASGYPYEVNNAYDAYKWDYDIDKAKQYIKMFPQYELVRVFVSVDVVPVKIE